MISTTNHGLVRKDSFMSGNATSNSDLSCSTSSSGGPTEPHSVNINNENLLPANMRRSLMSDSFANSLFTGQLSIKIELNLTQREIDVIREVWAKMMEDEALSGTSNCQLQQKKDLKQKIVTTSGFASSNFCRQFYGNLLSLHPELEALYPSIRHQAIHFAGVLTTLISNLEHPENMDYYLECLARRHSRVLNIETAHFDIMGIAFMDTLSNRLGYEFTLEIEDAWIKVYSYLANKLLQDGIDPPVPSASIMRVRNKNFILETTEEDAPLSSVNKYDYTTYTNQSFSNTFVNSNQNSRQLQGSSSSRFASKYSRKVAKILKQAGSRDKEHSSSSSSEELTSDSSSISNLCSSTSSKSLSKILLNPITSSFTSDVPLYKLKEESYSDLKTIANFNEFPSHRMHSHSLSSREKLSTFNSPGRNSIDSDITNYSGIESNNSFNLGYTASGKNDSAMIPSTHLLRTQRKSDPECVIM